MNKQEQSSSTEKVLTGKLYPGAASPIVRVTKDRGKRIIHLRNGEEIKTTKQTLREFVHGTVNDTYRTKAVRSLQTKPDGTTAVTLGGSVKGDRKHYATLGAAKAAITRHYGKGH